MKNPTAILSMLHEGAHRNSATRLFRGEAVLRWTLKRVAQARRIASIAILCWEDQLEQIAGEASRAFVLAKGPRTPLKEVEAVSAARRWADGWRGGLLSTCDFDLGFYGPWAAEIAANVQSDALVLVDPSAGLVDPAVLDGLVDHATAHPEVEMCFVPAAPGLGGALLRGALVNRLAVGRTHGGRLLHYLPDQTSREQLAGDMCAPVATTAARTTRQFKLDSDRMIARVGSAMVSLNGHLISSGAEELVARAHAWQEVDALPREVTLEINTARRSRPVFWPGSHQDISRPEMSVDTARRLFAELSELDDTRLTISGVGDPLLHPNLFEIVDSAAREGRLSVHVETDLIGVDAEAVVRLAESPVDIVSIHLPALTSRTYESIMGVDGYAAVVESISEFVKARKGRGVPILVPTFTKCRQNLVEMEAWYDQWLRALGSAVIRGPSDFGGQIPDLAVADMAPAKRKPCGRLLSRMTILSDGRMVSCEQDVLGRQALGQLGVESVRDVWSRRFGPIRADHRTGALDALPVCRNCREWHRP